MRTAHDVHDALLESARHYAGPNPEGLRTVARARRHPDMLPGLTGYAREKALSACGWLEIYLSERKWRQWGDDPWVVRGFVLADLAVFSRNLPDVDGRVPQDSNAG